MRYLTILFLVSLVGCSSAYVAPALDAGPPADAQAAPDAHDYRTDCADVAAAYEAARARFNCSYDWPACPRTLLTNEQCVAEFATTVSCGHLDTIASRCSL